MAERTTWQRIARRIRVPMGFLFAALFLWLAHPKVLTLWVSLLLVAPGLALRAYASGYVRKNSELTTTGPYSYTRNPLYMGSLLIAVGFGIGSGNLDLAGFTCGALSRDLSSDDYRRRGISA